MQSGKCFSGSPGNCWSTGAQSRLFFGRPQDSYSAGPPHKLLTSFFPAPSCPPGPWSCWSSGAQSRLFWGSPKNPCSGRPPLRFLTSFFSSFVPDTWYCWSSGTQSRLFWGFPRFLFWKATLKIIYLSFSPFVPTRPLVLLELWNTEQTVLGGPHDSYSGRPLAESLPLSFRPTPTHSILGIGPHIPKLCP